jgi:Zn-dependent protease
MDFKVGVDLTWFMMVGLLTVVLSHEIFPRLVENLSTFSYWMMGFVSVLGLYASVVVHELAHSIVGRRYGMQFEWITMWMLGGIARAGSSLISPKKEFVMVAAGPLSNLILCGLLYLFVLLGSFMGLGEVYNGIVFYLVIMNAFIAAFNLLPAFPVDGGRILHSVLWAVSKSQYTATLIAGAIGMGFGFSLIILGFGRLLGLPIGGFFYSLIGFFITVSAYGHIKQEFQSRRIDYPNISNQKD